MNNLAIVLKHKRDEEARLARTSPQPVFNDDGTNQSIGVLPHTHSEYAVLSGASAPTTSTAGILGQFYLETATPTLYQCTDTETDYTWTEVGGGGSYTLPQATGTTLGGIIAATKTTESAEVKIDAATGKLYVTAAGEAANGLTAGGTAGQILSKVDGTDYNAEWIDAPSGGAIVAPSLRASASAYGSGNAASITIPSTAEVGDFLILFVGSNYAYTGVTAGWSLVAYTALGYHNFATLFKVCAAGDAGSTVTVNLSGPEPWNITIAVVKDVKCITGFNGTQAESGTTRSTGVATFSGNYSLLFGSARVGSKQLTCDKGSLILSRTTDAAQSSALWEVASLGPPISATVTSPSATQGMSAAVVAMLG